MSLPLPYRIFTFCCKIFLKGEKNLFFKKSQNAQRRQKKVEIDKKLLTVKCGYAVLSLLICIFGIAVIASPDFSSDLIYIVGGSLLIAFGCVRILGYLSKDLYRLAFQFDLAFGILLILLGLFLILRKESLTETVCILIGIFILADSLLKIQTSVDAKKFGLPLWWLIFVSAAVSSVFGIMLMFWYFKTEKEMMIPIGISFLCEGILNLSTALISVKILRKKSR